MIGLVAFLVACGGGGPLDAPHPPPEWPVAPRPVVAPVVPPPATPAPEAAPPVEGGPDVAKDTDAPAITP